MDGIEYRLNHRISFNLRNNRKGVICSETTPFPASRPEDYIYDGLGADPDDNPPDIPARGWPTGDELYDATFDFDLGSSFLVTWSSKLGSCASL